MKTILQHNPAKQDNVEAMADALVESMRFADPTVDYPDISKAKADDGVPAEWFHKAYAGITGTSELTAILQAREYRLKIPRMGCLGETVVPLEVWNKIKNEGKL